MAEAASDWTTKVLCRYFLHGVCRAGDNCRYSHDLSADKQESACTFYLKGSCTYGDKCRYDHVRPKKEGNDKHQKPCGSGTRLKPAPLKLSTMGPKPLPSLKQDKLANTSKMITLKKQGQSLDSGIGEDVAGSPLVKNPGDWVKAAAFVPGQLWQGSAPCTYGAAVKSGLQESDLDKELLDGPTDEETAEELCPFAAHGECRYGENCTYIHGDICDMCRRATLHPTDQDQRDKHIEDCLKQHEEDMELSFAIQRSKDKSCGICMETVMEKNPPSERRFGILSNCDHVFCLACIRKWRAAKQFENKVIRSCPECRVKSDFVTPSKYWIESREQKDQLIEGYKQALGAKPCKYFDQGRGECPFNENCFYMHAYPDGRKASPRPQRRRRRQNVDGDLGLLQTLILWDFFEEHLNRTLSMELELEDQLDLILRAHFWNSSSDDSDYSDGL